MKIKQSTKMLLASSILFASTSQAAVVTSLIGDIDNLGGHATSTSFTGYFDARSASESAATNGAQYTDNAGNSFGTIYSHAIFTHSFTAFSTITSASWELGIGGLQSGNDKLFLDGSLIASGSQLPSQSSNGYGIFTIDLASSFSSLLDGLVVFDLDLNSGGSEPVVFDYAKLTINGTLAQTSVVPVPAAAFMFAPALLGFMGLRRKAKNLAA